MRRKRRQRRDWRSSALRKATIAVGWFSLVAATAGFVAFVAYDQPIGPAVLAAFIAASVATTVPEVQGRTRNRPPRHRSGLARRLLTLP